MRLPFLDYGTLERRRAMCHAELVLNRRFAPRLYRRVVALVPGASRALAIAPEDDPRAVEYAVEMRRYDEGDTLAARLARGAASAELAHVGAAVARAHARSPVHTSERAITALGGAVDETLAALAGARLPAPERERLADLSRFCRAGLTGLGPVLRRRAAAGLVRDGHGDLRAEHVLLERDVEFVDGLEFDPALRIADIGYDLAFLVMDVARRDDALARALVQGYAQAGGDPGAGPLPAFFVVVRALVRAKVDLLRAAQLEGQAAAERTARAHALLALAERFAWRARLPPLTCVTGLSATGKSMLASALGQAAGRRVLTSDVLRKARAGLRPEQPGAPALYADAASRALYAELGELAGAAVGREGGILVDATFRCAEDAAAFRSALPKTAGAACIVVEAPPAVMLQRARLRAAVGGSASDAGVDAVAAQLAAGPASPPFPPVAIVDGARPLTDSVAMLARQLDRRLAPGASRSTGR